MKSYARTKLTLCALLVTAVLSLAACAAPAAEVAVETLPTAAPTVTSEPSAPLLLIGWDDAHGRVVRAVDPLTGIDVPGYAPLPFGGERDAMFITPHAVAPDGGSLAVLDIVGSLCYGYAGGETCGPRSTTVYLVDVTAWTMLAIPFGGEGWVGQIAFRVDGQRLAVAVQSAAYENTLVLLDTATGERLAEAALEFAPSRLGFAADGATVVAYGQPMGDEAGMTPPPPPRVTLLEGATLASVWETTLDDLTSGHWCVADCQADHGTRKMISVVPAVVLSPDGTRLHIVHADEARLTTVDLAQRAVQTAEIGAPTTWLDRLLALTARVAHAKGPMDSFSRHAVLSDDGRQLYVGGYDFTMTKDGAGGWIVEETMQPLQRIDAATGAILAEQDAPSHSLRLSPDGARLLVLDLSNNAEVTRVLDPHTLSVETRVEGLNVVIALDVTGRVNYLAQDFRHHQVNFTLLDPMTLEPVTEWAADGPAWLIGAGE